MKKRLEMFLIKKILNNSGLEKKDIDIENKTINLGLWGISTIFFKPYHCFILSILINQYKYQCYQEEFVIKSIFK